MSREDLDRILNHLIEVAQVFLQKRGAFYSFGAVIALDGELRGVMADTGEEHPDDNELVGMILQIQSEQTEADKIRASGLCEDMKIQDPATEQWTRAIKVALEGLGESPVNCYVPFEEKKEGLLRRRTYDYGELYAIAAEPRVFKRQD